LYVTENFLSGYMPRELPTTCLSVEPRFDPSVLAKHNPCGVPHRGQGVSAKPNSALPASTRRPLSQMNQVDAHGDWVESTHPQTSSVMEKSVKYMMMIRDQLTQLLSMPNLVKPNTSFLGEFCLNS
jgi:hypothetical protein